MAKMYDMSVDDLKELLGLGDEVTEDTTWGDAYDMATLEKIVGEEGLEVFKEQYGKPKKKSVLIYYLIMEKLFFQK